MAKEKGVTKVWLEGDSMNIINYLKGVKSPSWSIEHLIEDSITILNYLQEFYISHVYCQANGVADLLENLGVSLTRS